MHGLFICEQQIMYSLPIKFVHNQTKIVYML